MLKTLLSYQKKFEQLLLSIRDARLLCFV